MSPAHDPLARQTGGQQSGGASAPDFPDESDVREGVEFGDGSFTGTLVDTGVITPTGDGFDAMFGASAAGMMVAALGRAVTYTPWKQPGGSVAALVQHGQVEIAEGTAGKVKPERLVIEVLQSEVATIKPQRDRVTVDGKEWVLIQELSANGEMRELEFGRAPQQSATGRGRDAP